jgi:hypothetical protein
MRAILLTPVSTALLKLIAGLHSQASLKTAKLYEC